jgi:hypothetical protein
MLLTDVEALGMIAKPGLISYSPLCSASQCLGRKDTDALHVLVSIIELVNVLEEKNGAHGAAANDQAQRPPPENARSAATVAAKLSEPSDCPAGRRLDGMVVGTRPRPVPRFQRPETLTI